MLKVKRKESGVVLEVKVQPKASRNKIEKAEEGKLKVKVTVPPEKGKANKAVIELLSKALKVPKSRIEIIKGETSRIKTVFIDGISEEDLEAKLGIKVSVTS